MIEMLDELNSENNSYFYHFCQLDLRKIYLILNSKIYFSDVRTFNDPFEMYYFNSIDENHFREKVESKIAPENSESVSSSLSELIRFRLIYIF
jgi:hypothetical protein